MRIKLTLEIGSKIPQAYIFIQEVRTNEFLAIKDNGEMPQQVVYINLKDPKVRIVK